MRIISVLPTYDPTNASVVRRIALMNSVSELGIESEIIFVKNSVDDIPDNYRLISKRKLSFLIVLILNIRNLLQLIKPGDAVLLYGFSFWDLFLLSIFKKFKKYHLYNEITEYPDVVNFTGFKCKIFDTILLNKLNGLFVISEQLKQYYSAKINDNIIFRLNMLVDMSRFASFTHKTNEKKVIAYCGSGVNAKDGVDLLIKAFAHLCLDFDKLELMLIGSRPCPDYERNVFLVEQLGLTESVRFVGPVHYSQIPDLLQQADVLVLARPHSRQAEGGFPTKLGEYLCTGIPVVTTNVGEIHHYLTDNENVLFVKSENPIDIAERIGWALKNREAAFDIARRGKAQVYNNFSSISQARHLIKSIYESNNNR